ncbi:sensor histidine kinase [Streptomyces mirabilis]|uniref:sensor histidine kinase n=1 Tax=Streptomyces mirabilis TaxID=68239 RepID=UPI0036CF9FE9
MLGLAGLLYGAAQATRPGLDGRHLAALVLTVGIGLGWSGWLAGQYTGCPTLSLAAVALLSASGGAMVPLSAFGAVVVGVAALCAATLIELMPAAALGLVGVIAAAVAAAIVGQGFGGLPAAATGVLLGLLVGVARRQQRVRERADAELAVERERSLVEHERAELLAERNRIAREVHDVLAHTLSALAIQMTALDSLVEDGADAPEVRGAIGRSRRLVVEGLEETRRAVRTLRDEPVALDEQLAALADSAGAVFRPSGTVRSLPPTAGMALLRVTQEALTNARKHASGAPVTVELVYGETSTRLVVVTTAADESGLAPAGELAATGSGYGLHGMRERVELLGGTFSAGPAGDGWRVEGEVPA